MSYTQWMPGDIINEEYVLIECTEIVTNNGSLLWKVKCLSCGLEFLAVPTHLRNGKQKCKCRMKYKKREVKLYAGKSW